MAMKKLPYVKPQPKPAQESMWSVMAQHAKAGTFKPAKKKGR